MRVNGTDKVEGRLCHTEGTEGQTNHYGEREWRGQMEQIIFMPFCSCHVGKESVEEEEEEEEIQFYKVSH